MSPNPRQLDLITSGGILVIEDPRQASNLSQAEQQGRIRDHSRGIKSSLAGSPGSHPTRQILKHPLDPLADYITFNRGLELCDFMAKQAVETHVTLTNVDQTRAIFLDFWFQLGEGLNTALVKGRLPSHVRTPIQLGEQMNILTEVVSYSGIYGQLIVDKDRHRANAEQLRRGLTALELYLQGDKAVVEKTTTASMHKHKVSRIDIVEQLIKDSRAMLAKLVAKQNDEVRIKPIHEFGWSICMENRLHNHMKDNNLNFLLHLLMDTAGWLFPTVFGLEQYPLLIVTGPEIPAPAEIFIHQLAQGYVWNTVGLSHEPARISVHGADNVTARTWKDAKSFISAKTSYCANADKLKLVVDCVQGLRRTGAAMSADVEDEAMVAERDYARMTQDQGKRLEIALEEYTEACLLEHVLTTAINVAQMFPPPDPKESTVVQPSTEIEPDQASD